MLIVEPDPALGIGLADLLRGYAIQVAGTAQTVREAIETVRAERPTVVIAEPRGYGITLIDQVHAVDARLPVIVHTTLGDETQPLVRRYGGFALLTKGETSADQLVQVVSSAHARYLNGPPTC